MKLTHSLTAGLLMAALLVPGLSAEARRRPEPRPAATTFDGLPLYSNVPAGATLLKAFDFEKIDSQSTLCDLKAKISLQAEEWIIKMQQDRTLDAYFSGIYFVIANSRSQVKYAGSTYRCETTLGGLFNGLINGIVGLATVGQQDAGLSTCRTKETLHYAKFNSAKLLIFGLQRAPQEKANAFQAAGCAYLKNQGDPRCQAGVFRAPTPMVLGVVDDAPARCE